MDRKRFFIIDGFAHVFRAFYGVRGLENNAVYGVTTMLNKMLADESPDYLAVAFDSPVPTFRKELYPEYKANRDAMPEDLVPQVPLIKELFDAYNIPRIQVDGFEADDIIGTMAHRAAEAGLQAVIVSSDKDMLQLLKGDEVVLYDPKKKIHFLGESGVSEHFGCRAEQVIDLLSIWGDSADNIPGIPGVGEKGAKQLLEQYGSIEGIYENLDQIKRKKYREGFEASRDNIALLRKLVTICTDMDLTFDDETYRYDGADSDKIHELFTRLNFKSLLKGVPIELKRRKRDYDLLDSEEALNRVLNAAREAEFCVFDLETTSLDPHEATIVGMALAVNDEHMGYVPLRHTANDETWTQLAESLLKPMIADAAITKCAHNAKYDIGVLLARGWELDGVFDDTMAMSYLLTPEDNRHGMDDLAEMLLSYRTIHFEDVCGQGKDQITFDQVNLKDACNYAAEDADITLRLFNLFQPQIDEEGLRNVYETVERPLIPVLARMETNGIRVNSDYLLEMSADMGEQIEGLEKQIYELAGEEFNIKSTKQLGHILFEKMGLPAGRKTGKTGAYSTDQTVLEGLAKKGHELPAKLLEYRMVTKLKSTYVDNLPKLANPSTGRIHGSFNQFVTATGRLSSNNPNLQNIPIRTDMGREIRAAFVPQEGWVLVGADYSQIELRLMAHFSEDKTLVDGFKNGEDIHTRTAGEIMDVDPNLVTAQMRAMAKSINFGLIYGMGEFRLAQELGISRKKAGEYITTYFEKMPNVLTFRDAVIEQAKEDGLVRTYAGRKRELPELQSRNKNLQAQGERLAVNTKIQGSAAELIKLAMIQLDERLRKSNLQARVLLQVHDELVLECPADEEAATCELLREAMEGVVDFRVPLTVEVHTGANWKATK